MFVLERVVEFYRLNSGALWFIHVTELLTIRFHAVTIALRYSNLEE